MNAKQKDADEYQRAITMLQKNSIDIAVKKLDRMSKSGNGHADSILGVVFEFGRGSIVADPYRALHYYERSVSSVGALLGWMGIGRICLQGPMDLRDPKKALECFSVAANNSNHPQAWLAMGEIYMSGCAGSRDFSVAEDCFHKAADLGSVHGYIGMARVAFKEGRFFSSVRYRISAFLCAKKILSSDSGQDGLKRWYE